MPGGRYDSVLLICPREDVFLCWTLISSTPLWKTLLINLAKPCKTYRGLCYTLATWYIGIETYNRPWGIAVAPKKTSKRALCSRHPFVATLQKSAREKRPEFFISDMPSTFDYLKKKKQNRAFLFRYIINPHPTHNSNATRKTGCLYWNWGILLCLAAYVIFK